MPFRISIAMGDQTTLKLQFVSFTVPLHLEKEMRGNDVGVPRQVSNRDLLVRSSLDVIGFFLGNSFVKGPARSKLQF